ncbi:type VI secretion system protein ImpG [Acidobacteria bacterium Mor1]|nr:type VI secretion system protein ImpG [Acidobacteria bacterium Mor1]
MNPRLLKYYNRELQHLREMGAEFAKEYPKVAGRLSLEEFECADPYVERLLEGFGFLAARIQLKLDAEFPQFTQHLLEMVYPDYLSPTPSMTVVQLNPDPSEGSLAEGFEVPRGTMLRSQLGKGEQTACDFRTAHDVTLWPVTLDEVRYFTYSGDIASLDVPGKQRAKSGIRFRLKTTGGLSFDKLALDRLTLYLRGIDELPMQIYERLFANRVAMLAVPPKTPAAWHEVIEGPGIAQVGFDDEQSLLPGGPRSFHGHRLVHEYFAFPQRFMFVELCGLAPAVRRCTGDTLDVVVLLDRNDSFLENAIDASQFSLFCSPAVNLFEKRCDRIHLSERQNDYHVVPDRTRALDYEVYRIEEVTGYGAGSEARQDFLPFYSADALSGLDERHAYYAVQREPRVVSSKQRRHGARSGYLGSEVFVSLVDGKQAPYRSDLKQLAVTALCSNRDLPLLMTTGRGRTDFTLDSGAPVESIRCVSGPTKPRPSWVEGDVTWRLISHLSLNYLSMVEREPEANAKAVRELLSLYGEVSEATTRKQIEGVISLQSSGVVRRMPVPGPLSFGRGLGIDLTLDESAFEGTGVFLLGAVLEQFFARYVSLNSFTETTIRSRDRGEVMRWPVRSGRRHLL